MSEALSVLKAKILICLLEMEMRDCTVTHLANVFCVAKSTVSRAADWCEKNNMMERNGDRTLKLTVYGRQLAENYKHRRGIFMKWLISEGVSRKAAERDAMVFALEFSEESVSLVQKLAEMQRIRERFSNKTYLSGREFCEALEDGCYSIPFVFYRCTCRNGYCISPSMANDGFEHPGELVIKNGNGLIILKAKPVEHMSFLGGMKIRGILQSLKYQDGGKFREAGKEGDTFCFPASILSFLHIGAEHILQGGVVLKMSCSAGKLHMPESTAIFTMFL